jgi:1,4-dihydroxy-2-naphthoyl-CoA hydrolase
MKPSIERLWQSIKDPKNVTLIETLGIEITDISESGVKGTMPVDHRTVQYYRMLHGGANVALAESLCSLGALVFVDSEQSKVVGLEINANHVRGMPEGSKVFGEAKPIHVGKKTQIWQIEIRDEKGKLVCSSRCTIAVLPLAGA